MRQDQFFFFLPFETTPPFKQLLQCNALQLWKKNIVANCIITVQRLISSLFKINPCNFLFHKTIHRLMLLILLDRQDNAFGYVKQVAHRFANNFFVLSWSATGFHLKKVHLHLIFKNTLKILTLFELWLKFSLTIHCLSVRPHYKMFLFSENLENELL